MMSTTSGGKWAYKHDVIFLPDGGISLHDRSDGPNLAKRICECVNALDGIDDVDDFVNEAKEAIRLNDLRDRWGI